MTASWKLLPALCFISGCAHAQEFPYRWHGVVPSQGVLTGIDKKDDLPLSQCEPDAKQKGRCIVMDDIEFERLRADFIRLKHELKALEEAGSR
jgi:hypothetical protein